ncbi:MAG TPA: hypothetical protein ENI87_13830 [bacterium]|nr:hypothetical protein [bacterium]
MRSSLALLLVTATLLGQSRRRPTFGRIVDADGDPLASAVVTFVGGLPHVAPTLQKLDVVEVAADQRGRAIARLRPDLCYVAWALGPVVDGRRAVAPPQGFFAAGAMLELRCQEVLPETTCRLAGLDAWAHLGELRCFAMTPAPGIECELEPGPDGEYRLPGPHYDRFEVRLADGQPLWHTRVQAELTLPPPGRIVVRAVDEHGGPIQGARVTHRVGRLSGWSLDGVRGIGGDRTRMLGTTDADGRCVVEVPCAGEPLRDKRHNLLLFVKAAGCAAVAGGVWSREFYVDDHRVPAIAGEELRFTCVGVEPLAGVVKGAPPGTIAQLAAVCKLHLQQNSYLHDARVFSAEVQADGSFAFNGVPAELHSCRLSLLPPGGSDWRAPVFAPESGRELPFEVRPQPVGTPPIAARDVALEVVDARGGPARGAVAFVSAGDRSRVLLRDSLLRVPLDERGRANLRLVAGTWVVVLVTAEGYCGEKIEVRDATKRVRLTQKPFERAVVKLLDRNGAPVAGARLVLRGSRTRGTSDPLQSMLQGMRRVTQVQWGRLRTDEHGVLRVPYVPVDGVVQRVELRWEGGRSDPFELGADEQVTVHEADGGR